MQDAFTRKPEVKKGYGKANREINNIHIIIPPKASLLVETAHTQKQVEDDYRQVKGRSYQVKSQHTKLSKTNRKWTT